MKVYLSVLLSFLLCFGLKAQSQREATKLGRYCATDELHEYLIQSDTAYAARAKQTEALIYKRQTTKNQRTEGNTTIYNIPVVIHIIHDNGPENISDQQVMDGLKHINDAFRHISPFDGAGGADIGIQFCLSRFDPSGNPTTGILRVQSELTNVKMGNDQRMKDTSRWDSSKYLNIWLVREICLGEECRVNGYATYASSHGKAYDGVVIKALQFGRWENLSKIPIHEIGHYFNLIHTFVRCINDDCTTNGDLVCDTPPDRSMDEIPCGTTMNSCTTDEDDTSLNNPFRSITLRGLGEQNDQTQNYMDYGNLDCINLFTEGQKTRMISALLEVRSSLLNSNGCITPCPFQVSFNSSSLSIEVGQTLSFTNTSTGVNRFQWTINGSLFSIEKNTTYTFPTTGVYLIQLIAYNADSSCINSKSIPITVIPTCVKPHASFQPTDIGSYIL